MPKEKNGRIVLRANIADYPITRALREGRVASDLVEFDFAGPETAHEGFRSMLRDRAYDVSELALATFLQAKSYGKPVSMIPAVVSGRFQHDCICYNAAKGELAPKDIEGRRIAVRSYTQTTGLWVRGILTQEYGVDLAKVTWVCSEGAHLAEYPDPENVMRMDDADLVQMVVDGELDGLIIGAAAQPKHPNIRPLIPNPKAAAEAWYEKYQAVPINHVVVLDSDLARGRPDVTREVYRMLSESKRFAGLTGFDTLRFGFEENRKAIEIGMGMALEQKIIARPMSVDELYADAAAIA